MSELILNKRRDLIPSNAVYIGRGSKWGNPFIIGKDGDRAEVIVKYRAWILDIEYLLEALPELHKRPLLCYCAPLPCHGNVLLELLQERGYV